MKEEYLRFIEEAGFQEVKIVQEKPFVVRSENGEEIASLLSATFWARKGNR